MQAAIPLRKRNGVHELTDAANPENSRKFGSIFNAVWGELRQYPNGENIKKEVAERVVLYSRSGLQDDQRIKLAVLNSFGLSG